MARLVKAARRQTSEAIERRNAMWATRIAAAETPRQKAAVEWDWLRSEVRKFTSRAAQDNAWNVIRKALNSALDEIHASQEQAVAEAAPCPSSRQRRPATRATRLVYDAARRGV